MNYSVLKHYLLAAPALRDSLGGKEFADTLLQGSSVVLLTVSLAAWFVAWRFFKIEKQGRRYYFANAGIALLYLPFLVWHFFRCYAADFKTGKEHYLLFFLVHSTVVVFWSLGFYGKNKEEEAF